MESVAYNIPSMADCGSNLVCNQFPRVNYLMFGTIWLRVMIRVGVRYNVRVRVSKLLGSEIGSD